MPKSFKEIEKNIEAKQPEEDFRRDSDGRAIVELCVRNDDDFLSPYSSDARSIINSDVSEFIDNSVLPLKPDEHIRLEIHSNEITAEEQTVYTAAIHSYYAEQFLSNKRERSRLLKMAIIMAAIGVIALAVTISLMAAGKAEIIAEVIDIFAWVFMWEAVDIQFFQRSHLKVKQKRCLSLADCPVDYLPLETPPQYP